MKKVVSLVVCLSLLLPLVGCFEKNELKETAIVQAIGIDLADDGGFIVTLQTYEPQSSSNGIDTAQNNAGILTGQGQTLSQAMHNCTISTGETLFTGYNRLIVIGASLAESGIADLFSYFDRDMDTRQNVEVAVADGLASDIVSADITQGILAAQTLEKMLIQTDESGYISTTPYYLLSKNMYLYNGSAVLPILTLLEDDTAEGNIASLQQVDATSSAVFADYCMVDVLDADQTRGNVLLQDELTNTVVVTADSYGNLATVSIYDCAVELSVQWVDDVAVLVADVTAKGTLDEVLTHQTVDSQTQLEEFEEGCEAVFSDEMGASFDVMVTQNGADVLYLSERIRQADLSMWECYQQTQEDWLKSVQLAVNVDVQINRIGMQTNQDA